MDYCGPVKPRLSAPRRRNAICGARRFCFTAQKPPEGAAMKRFGFPEKFKLKRSSFFELIFEKGRRTATSAMTVWHLDISHFPELKEETAPKLGIIVSKRLGNSVIRNRVKRLVREMYRLSRAEIKDGFWLILSPRKAEELKTAGETRLELKKILEKADILR